MKAENQSRGQTLAEKLAAYAAALKYEDIPADVIHQTKRTIWISHDNTKLIGI